MTQTKPTPGPWEVERPEIDGFEPRSGHFTKRADFLTIVLDFGNELDGHNYIDIRGPNQESNASLIAEAGTVYHETGLSPRQLLEQRDELLEAAEIALGHMTGGMDGNWADCDPRDKLRTAIAKIEGKTSKKGV